MDPHHAQLELDGFGTLRMNFLADPSSGAVRHWLTAPHGQLEAFVSRVREGTPLPLDADDAMATMTLIDWSYRAAGFEPRPRTTVGG